jgi:hypothetical protein
MYIVTLAYSVSIVKTAISACLVASPIGTFKLGLVSLLAAEQIMRVDLDATQPTLVE